MRVLDPYESNMEDRLQFSFRGTFDPREPVEREFEVFLHALEASAGPWMPNVVQGKRNRKYSRANFWKAFMEVRDEVGVTLGLYRTTRPALEMTFRTWSPNPSEVDVQFMLQPLSLFAEEARCRDFIDMVRAWASRYPVTYAVAHSHADEQLSGAPNFGRDTQVTIQDGFDKIYGVYWFNIFGPALVEAVGRERMLSTPGHLVEELPGGGVLLVTWPTVTDFASEGSRQAQARALAHLRPDLDVDTVLLALRDRSATLAAVEPHFHPDVEPLLSRVTGACVISERQRKIAEFNACPPPEPEEWLPANAAFPVDVQDPADAREHYATLAEHLVAILHTKVPSVFETTPESLTDVDFHLWDRNFPETFERWKIDEQLMPAVGAYLGEVLVRRLGGQWLPRKKLEEAQVRVGNRVWLPFVRAQRYLGSRQALVDFSLTQIYREAERHPS
ncbi:hypothetical protein D7Y13_31415 [Corallococcus praedator]|uniref:Uncharacterized protein n=2 Tax=Corallococcus praedator TaxID=2316724 RepID=A0ABX9Q939_9BACT|nr:MULTISPECIES: hypothetical protein [Corallococcus]RKH33242.1 hypothetical protein D7X75_12735 [Corallococcus sp. CA031C]RKH95973.1 hypothetical protein D7Y13_31415 [Corallococcus praedator]